MDLYAPHYRTNTLTNSSLYQRERQRFAAWVAGLLNQHGTELGSVSALDVGCGTGEILELMGLRGCKRLTGLDISPGMLEQARRRLPGATFVQQSVDEFGRDGRQFDLVTAAFTVHHLHDPRAFFELADRVLPPGGWFCVLEYNMASWSHRPRLGAALDAPLLPLRVALKLKNRKHLARLDRVPALFNSAHRQLTVRELAAAIPNPESYDLQSRTHGLWLPGLKHALCGEAPVDRALMRFFDALERRILPADKGHYQWLAGRRR